jgi:hypothetical protein
LKKTLRNIAKGRDGKLEKKKENKIRTVLKEISEQEGAALYPLLRKDITKVSQDGRCGFPDQEPNTADENRNIHCEILQYCE